MTSTGTKTLFCTASHPSLLDAHDGTDQNKRFPKALSPDYFKLHEYSTSDLLTIAAGYARQLVHYDDKNTPQGDFSAFIEKDASTFISKMARFDPTPYSTVFSSVFTSLQQTDTISDISASGLFGGLFQLFGQLAVVVDDWYMGTVNGLPSNAAISQAIREPLSRVFISAFGLHIWAREQTSAISDTVPGQVTTLCGNDQAWIRYRFSDIWNCETTQSFPEFIATATALPAPGDNSADHELIRIKSAAFYLNDLFKTLHETVMQLTVSAHSWLEQTLEKWPEHDAHMGLFLSFIRLLKIIYARGNTVTQKHLDFYYKEVLGFSPKSAVPDCAYLFFELAKTSEHHLLKKGTRFKAGKDREQNDIIYQLVSELALSCARVKSLRSVHIQPLETSPGQIKKSRLLSARVADSADGNGQAFEVPDNSFDIFGKPEQNAQIGLTLASPILRLAQGTRKITLNFKAASGAHFPTALSAEHFQLFFTGKKKWITPDLVTKNSTGVPGNEFEITATLSASQGAVVDYSSQIDDGIYQTPYPLCKIILANSPSSDCVYEALKDISLDRIDITTDVDHIRAVHIQTDSGIADAAKPLRPFGVAPVCGACVYFGYDEMFEKNITRFNLSWDWVDLPTNFYSYYSGYSFNLSSVIQTDVSIADMGPGNTHIQQYLSEQDRAQNLVMPDLPKSDLPERNLAMGPDSEVPDYQTDALGQNIDQQMQNDVAGARVVGDILKESYTAALEILNNGTWSAIDQTIPLFTRSGTGPISNPQGSENPERVSTGSLTSSSADGFLRLKLTAPTKDPFGHRQYPALYTQKVIELNAWAQDKTGSSPVLPNAPHTPVMENIKLSYTARTTLSLNGTGSQYSAFYHNCPFGVETQNLDTNTLYFMPRFQSQDKSGVLKHNQAEFYIGLSDAVSNSNIALLFYLAEGSGDPEIPLPDITWSWYTQTGWAPAAAVDITGPEETKALLGTGILTFTIPKDIYQDAPIMGQDGIWLKASVTKNHSAIPRMIRVVAQAGQVCFVSDNTEWDPDHMPLAEESISKFVSKPGAVKKALQPFPSFDGAPKESDAAFYQRVAERLRHKNRAITAWDYERLILENFSDIFKVKCLSHSVYNYQDESDPVCIPAAQFAPGGTTLVIIPKITKSPGMDHYRPKTSLKKLTQIKNFIGTRCSVFVKKWLTVTNPLYERVHVTAQVQFAAGQDFTQYEHILKEDLKGFLAPWTDQNQMASISFGITLNQSDLIFFIEQRPYVDFVKSVSIKKYIGSSDTAGSVQTQLEPSTARSILVTDSDHTINPVEHDL